MEIENTLKRFAELPAIIKIAGEKLAKKEAKYRSLDNQSKNILNDIKRRADIVYSKNGSSHSETYLESCAYASGEWQVHLEGLNEAQKDYLQAKAKLAGLQTEHETLRTIISYKKSEINLI